jgi:hypothetical protein
MNRLKLLIVSSVVTILPGCALLDAYFMAGYDNQEYALINSIRTNAELNVNLCTDQPKSKNTFDYLYSKSVEFKNFTQYIPNNEDAFKLSEQMVELSKQGKEMYDKGDPVSTGFCKLKLQQINRTSEQIQKVIGSKPR